MSNNSTSNMLRLMQVSHGRSEQSEQREDDQPQNTPMVCVASQPVPELSFADILNRCLKADKKQPNPNS